MDICNFQVLQAFIIDNNINAVINCAAYTDVDKAEEDAEIAERVNSKGVANLVNALKRVNGKLIHISTDYVFDGNIFFLIKSQIQSAQLEYMERLKEQGSLLS